LRDGVKKGVVGISTATTTTTAAEQRVKTATTEAEDKQDPEANDPGHRVYSVHLQYFADRPFSARVALAEREVLRRILVYRIQQASAIPAAT
jgi:hypothetical protein